MLSREKIIRAILQLEASDKSLAGESAKEHSPDLYRDACEAFATWEIALAYAGVRSLRRSVDTDSISCITAADVQASIRHECAIRNNLLPEFVKRRSPKLYSVAVRLLKSWENAVISAGIGPDDTLKRLKRKEFYDADTIVRLLRDRYARGEPMAQFKVLQSQYLLGLSAVRAFGTWGKALEIAEVPQCRSVNRMRSWSRRSVSLILREMLGNGESIEESSVAELDRHLYVNALRLFGSWDEACKTIEGELPPVEKR